MGMWGSEIGPRYVLIFFKIKKTPSCAGSNKATNTGRVKES